MFKLQIEVTSIEDAERILACLKHSADPAAVRQVEGQIPFHAPGGLSDEESPAAKHFPGTTNTATNPPADEKPKNPRGRPRRQVAEPLPESAAPASEPSVTATPEAEAPVKEPEPQSYTLTDIRTALQAVQAKNPSDMQPVIAMLEKFGAARVSDVKAEDYPAFIEACKKAS